MYPTQLSPMASLLFVHLGEVVVHLAVTRATLQELALDEVIDALLQVCVRQLEAQLRHHLLHQQLVRQGLAHFHYAHDGGINRMLALLHDLKGSSRNANESPASAADVHGRRVQEAMRMSAHGSRDVNA